jgi:hypothetical protein
MNRSFAAVLLVALFAVSTAMATTYVRVEPDGTKTYSDRPIPGGKPIDVQPAQSYTPVPVDPSTSVGASSSSSSGGGGQEEEFRYESCQITPGNDENFTNPESVSISATTNPPVRATDILVMTVDGQRANGPDGRSHVMMPVDRGTHTVSVTVTSREGRSMCTASSSFHVQRPSLNSPARPAPPRPTPRPRG